MKKKRPQMKSGIRWRDTYSGSHNHTFGHNPSLNSYKETSNVCSCIDQSTCFGTQKWYNISEMYYENKVPPLEVDTSLKLPT